MNKSGIFIGVLLLGVLGMIVIFNQGQKTNTLPIDIVPSPKEDSVLTPKAAQIAPSQSLILTPTEAPKPPTANSAVIQTSKGEIGLTLYPNDAPNTVTNFVSKSKNGFYNNLTFHRVEDWVIQGGDPLGNGTGGNRMKTEINDKPFVVGALGVARGQDITLSNDSQFFITKKESTFLNGQYTNFGIVTRGMDVVEKIEVGDKILEITVE